MLLLPILQINEETRKLGNLAKVTRNQDFYPGGLVLEFIFLFATLCMSRMGHPHIGGIFYWSILTLLFDPMAKALISCAVYHTWKESGLGNRWECELSTFSRVWLWRRLLMNYYNPSRSFLGARSSVCPSRLRGTNKETGGLVLLRGRGSGRWGLSCRKSEDLLVREGRARDLKTGQPNGSGVQNREML